MAEPKIDTAKLAADIARINTRLKKLPAKIQNKVIRKALRPAAAIVAKKLKAEAPTGNKTLRRTFGTQVTTDKTAGKIVAKIGQSRAKLKKYKAVHVHRVDQDTRPHEITGAFFSGGELMTGTFQHPGTTGDQFMERSARQTVNQQQQAFAKKAAAEIDAEAAKL